MEDYGPNGSREGRIAQFGLVDEDNSQLHLTVGRSYKTSDFIVDSLESWWEGLLLSERDGTTHRRWCINKPMAALPLTPLNLRTELSLPVPKSAYRDRS